MRAVTFGDKYLCPKHSICGRVISGSVTVLICGLPAATHNDVVECEPPTLLIPGDYGVEIEGRGAVRQWDTTTDGGVVATGRNSVLIQPGSFDPVAAVIARIKASRYGQTWDGQMAVRNLERLHRRKPASGIVLTPHTEDDPEGLVADYNSSTDQITLYTHGEVNVEDVAAALVHEAHHAEIQRGRGSGRINPSEVLNERYAWDRELEFYEQQKKQGYTGTHPELEDYAAAEDRDEWIRNHHKGQPGFPK